MATARLGFCPYAVLGLRADAGVDDIRTAFRRAALRTHPDKPGGSCEAFNTVQCAYEALVGQGTAALLLGDWDAEVHTPGSAPSATIPATIPAPAAVTADFDPWNTATFDPWSASTWDPWSSASYNAAEAVTPSAAAQASVVNEAARAAVAEAAADQAARKKRQRADKMAQEARRRRIVGKGKGKGFEAEEEARKLTRYGVYGFRPSSSEDESEAEARARGAAAARRLRSGAPPHG